MTEGTAISGEQLEVVSIGAADAGHREAILCEVGDGSCHVELEGGRRVRAKNAVQGYLPAVEDRVLVAGRLGGALWIVGVLQSSGAQRLVTRSRHTVEVRDEAGRELVEIRDDEEALLLRIEPESGKVTLGALRGDLALHAPEGFVDLTAGRGVRAAGQESVTFSTRGDEGEKSATLHLDRRGALLHGEELELSGERASLHASETRYVGKTLEATVGQARWAIERVESVVGQLVERLETAHRTVSGLQRLTAGRVRTLVRGAYQLKARRGSLKSKEELKLDGKKIYLG